MDGFGLLLSSTLPRTGNNVFQFLTVLLVFVLVLIVTVYTTRWIGKCQKNSYSRKNLEICEAVRIGSTGKMIAVVRAGIDRYLVVGVGKDEIRLLAELSEDDLLRYDLEPETEASAQETVRTMLARLKKKDEQDRTQQ